MLVLAGGRWKGNFLLRQISASSVSVLNMFFLSSFFLADLCSFIAVDMAFEYTGRQPAEEVSGARKNRVAANFEV